MLEPEDLFAKASVTPKRDIGLNFTNKWDTPLGDIPRRLPLEKIWKWHYPALLTLTDPRGVRCFSAGTNPYSWPYLTTGGNLSSGGGVCSGVSPRTKLHPYAEISRPPYNTIFCIGQGGNSAHEAVSPQYIRVTNQPTNQPTNHINCTVRHNIWTGKNVVMKLPTQIPLDASLKIS